QYLMQAAWEYPDVRFCHATGTKAHTAKYGNYYNAFASIYQGRYLAGVAAGMKLQEMVAAGKITDANKDANGNIKLGYIGAYTYAEVVSGYTSWYLGVKSIVPNVVMDVTFTGSWYDVTAEKEGADTLISRGCAIISQHADSMGAPDACEEKGVPNVSYNGSTVDSCPNTFIVSSRINWAPYYEYVVGCAVNGTEIKVDWPGDLSTGSVLLTDVGPAAAAGTQAKLDEVKAKLVSGEIKVFDCNNFTVSNSKLTTYLADVDDMGDYEKETEAIVDGYFAESKYRSAPYFDITIDGITLLNSIY
ncbi:MAG: BMP family ABC transporter substrate-binding protein, partial [Christensenellales bacterium]